MERKIDFVLNGNPYSAIVDTREILVDLLRNRFHLTGTKIGCGMGNAAACTVLLDGQPVNSCLVIAAAVDGKEILTIEGVAGGTSSTPSSRRSSKRAPCSAGIARRAWCWPRKRY